MAFQGSPYGDHGLSMCGNGDSPSGSSTADARDLRRCALSDLLVRLYAKRVLRNVCVRAALRLEGGQLYSATLRRILAAYHGVVAGAAMVPVWCRGPSPSAL